MEVISREGLVFTLTGAAPQSRTLRAEPRLGRERAGAKTAAGQALYTSKGAPVEGPTSSPLPQLAEIVKSVVFEMEEESAIEIAAPVFNHAGQIAGALEVAAPQARVADVASLAKDVVDAAIALSKRLGYPTKLY